LLEASTLHSAGYHVTVICPADKGQSRYEVINGVHNYRYPAPWDIGGFVGYVAEFAYSMVAAFVIATYVLVRHGFDVVHVHTPPDMNLMVAWCFKLFCGKRVVMDHHDLSPELFQAQRDGKGSRMVESALKWFERTGAQLADRLIATNQTQRGVQIGRCGASPESCFVVRNGPDSQFLGEVKPNASIAADPRLKIGYVGVIGIQDGLEYLIRALAHLHRQRNDFLAVIVGDGDAMNSIKSMVEQLKLTDHVHFTGMVPYSTVPSYIAAFDICVTPDPSNPYNDSCTTIKTIEYMALGRPTVAFETLENRFTAQNAAIYAANNDEVAMSQMLSRLLDSPSERESMGRIARQRVDEFFTWDHQKTQLLKLYAELQVQYFPRKHLSKAAVDLVENQPETPNHLDLAETH
jgi:glycosyltransferase involved in cell wall biosynthesis